MSFEAIEKIEICIFVLVDVGNLQEGCTYQELRNSNSTYLLDTPESSLLQNYQPNKSTSLEVNNNESMN